jgi:hypothetical protein
VADIAFTSWLTIRLRGKDSADLNRSSAPWAISLFIGFIPLIFVFFAPGLMQRRERYGGRFQS